MKHMNQVAVSSTVILPTLSAGLQLAILALQSTPNLASAVWTTNLLAPVIVNGQYTITNQISATQQFFRSSQ
jgi:hypothetical protein